MADKTQIKRTDKDFKDYDVFIYGAKQDPNRVVSADVEKGQVWRYQVDGNGKVLPAEKGKEPPVELATGSVTIKPKAKDA